MDKHALADLNGKHVLVTGAGGSIGRELCKVIVQHAASLTTVNISESATYKVTRLLEGSPCPVRHVLGDYGDTMLMGKVLDGINIVIHAGAHKHVPICEENPIAAITNNVCSTQWFVNTCVKMGVSQFVYISTDKAVEPTSIMGATKRACELMLTRRSYTPMNVSVVRFGNVIGTDGSVIPLWKEQIAAGGPVTITDRRCTRYFMEMEDTVRLVLGVLAMKQVGLFVFDMGKPIRIEELLSRLLINSGQSDLDIVETGLRPGEKLEEELVHGGRLEPTKHARIFRIIEEGKLQPSHQYIPDLCEHAKRWRVADAIEVLWRIVHQANVEV